MKNRKTQNQIIQAFEQSCNQIVEAFIRKQGLSDEWHWIEDKPDPCGIISFGTDVAYLSFSDVYYDLKQKRKKGLILKWYAESALNEDDSTSYLEYCLIKDFVDGKIKEGKSFSSSNIEEIRKHLTK